jgi:hypothetical protein
MVRRVKVTLKHEEREGAAEYPGELMAEWVHEDEYVADELGVTLRWTDAEETFIPWTTVLRVDWDRCRCMDCKEREGA